MKITIPTRPKCHSKQQVFKILLKDPQESKEAALKLKHNSSKPTQLLPQITSNEDNDYLQVMCPLI
jgi:hypothetical protein